MHPYCYATSYFCVEAKNIESHASEIEIKYFKDLDTIAILLSAPEFIEGQKLKNIRLSKGVNGNVFVIPLSFESENKKVKSYFYANETTLFESIITVEYQLNIHACPSTIEIAMEHKPKYSENK